jgi:hypothetical protein
VSGIACKEELAVLHRLDYETSHWSNTLLKYLSFFKGNAVIQAKSALKFLPDTIIGPVFNRLIRLTLNVQPSDFRRSHAEECETS